MKNVTKHSIIFLITLCLVTLSAALAEENEIKIGIITDLSGPVAYWGKQTRIGAEIAKKEINEENDVKLKIVYGDHKLNTKFAVSEAQKFINIDQVDAIYSEFAPTSIAISPIVNNKNLLMVYAAGAESPAKSSKSIFKTYLDYRLGCKMLADSWKRKGFTRVGMLKINSEFGDLCLEGVKHVYPDVEMLDYNSGDDVKTQTLLFKTKGIQGLMIQGFENDLSTISKTLLTLKFKPEIGSCGSDYSETISKEFPELADKVALFQFVNISDTFLNDVQKKDPSNNLTAIEAAALAYTHMKQMYLAIKNCSNHNTECQIDKLESAGADPTIGFEGWDGSVAQFKIGLYRRKGEKLTLVKE